MCVPEISHVEGGARGKREGDQAGDSRAALTAPPHSGAELLSPRTLSSSLAFQVIGKYEGQS